MFIDQLHFAVLGFGDRKFRGRLSNIELFNVPAATKYTMAPHIHTYVDIHTYIHT